MVFADRRAADLPEPRRGSPPARSGWPRGPPRSPRQGPSRVTLSVLFLHGDRARPILRLRRVAWRCSFQPSISTPNVRRRHGLRASHEVLLRATVANRPGTVLGCLHSALGLSRNPTEECKRS